MGFFPPGHPCHTKKPVDRVCLYTGFKLAFRIAQLSNVLEVVYTSLGAMRASEHVLVKREALPHCPYISDN